MPYKKEKLPYYLSKLKSNPNDAEASFKAARIYDEVGDHGSALKYYEQAAKLNYNPAEAYLNMGFIYGASSDIDMALKCWEKSWDVNPKIVNVITDVANTAFYFDKIQEIETMLHKQIMLKSRNAYFYYQLGMFQHYFKNAEIALASFVKAQEINPKLLETYIACGEIFVRLNKINHAVLQFQKAIALDPSLHKPYYELGKIYEKENNLTLAQMQFEKAINCNPNSHQAHHGLGRIFAKQCKFDQAIKQYQHCLKLFQQNHQAHFDLAKAYQACYKIEEAIAEYEKTILLNPHHEAAYYDLALVYKQLGNTEKAVVHFNNLLKIEPANPYAHYNLGTIYLHQEKYNEAAFHLEAAVEVNPNDVYALYNLAISYYKLSRFFEAVSSAEKAISINPNEPEYYNILGESYIKLNKRNEAARCFESYAKLNPNGADVMLNLGILYLELKNYQKAIEIFEKSAGISQNLSGFYNASIGYYHLNIQEKTLLNLTQSENIDNNNYAVNHLKGCLEIKWHNNAEAAAQFFKASLKANPSFLNALIDLAWSLLQNNNEEEAMKLINSAQDQKNMPLEKLLSLAVIYARIKNINKAISLIDRAISAEKENWLTFAVWAYIYQINNDAANALKCYEKARKLNPSFAYAEEASSKLRENIVTETVPDFINEFFFTPYAGQIQEKIEIMEEDNPAAEEYCKEIDESAQEILEAYLQYEEKELAGSSLTILKLADAYMDLKKYDLAEEELNKLINENIKNKEILLKFGLCKSKLKKYAEAAQTYEEAFKIYNDKDILTRLITNLSKAKNKEKLKKYAKTLASKFDLTDKEKTKIKKMLK